MEPTDERLVKAEIREKNTFCDLEPKKLNLEAHRINVSKCYCLIDALEAVRPEETPPGFEQKTIPVFNEEETEAIKSKLMLLIDKL